MPVIVTKFFQIPFAEAGDKTAIPNDAQPDGSVSYEDGWTPDYELGPLDPDKKDVPRRETNQFYNDVSTALQEYQAWGAPNFISDTDNGGSPFPYDQYSKVLFDDGVNGPRIFQSKANTNTDEPVTAGVISDNWRLLDEAVAQAVIYDGVTFEGTVANGNAVYYNTGTNQYTKAIANGAAQQQMVGIADVTNSRVFASGLVIGQTGLTPGAVYYLSTTVAGTLVTTRPPSNVVQVGIARDATTLFMNITQEIPGAFLPVGTEINYMGTDGVQPGFLLEDGSAISRTTYAALFAKLGTAWGIGDGSTTFNLPDTRRLSAVGSGGTATSGPANTIASTFTAQLQTVPISAVEAHSHTVNDPGHVHQYQAQTTPGVDAVAGALGLVGSVGFDTIGAVTGITLGAAGGSAATLNTYGPSYVCDKQIFTGVF